MTQKPRTLWLKRGNWKCWMAVFKNASLSLRMPLVVKMNLPGILDVFFGLSLIFLDFWQQILLVFPVQSGAACKGSRICGWPDFFDPNGNYARVWGLFSFYRSVLLMLEIWLYKPSQIQTEINVLLSEQPYAHFGKRSCLCFPCNQERHAKAQSLLGPKPRTLRHFFIGMVLQPQYLAPYEFEYEHSTKAQGRFWRPNNTLLLQKSQTCHTSRVWMHIRPLTLPRIPGKFILQRGAYGGPYPRPSRV